MAETGRQVKVDVQVNITKYKITGYKPVRGFNRGIENDFPTRHDPVKVNG